MPPAPVTLLMAIHCHQPVGNFGFVFEEAYAKAYEPFLGVLERHPEIRLALHYSGCLLDWLLERRSDFLKRVKALVARGQVELLASGYYEPILPLIPEADRQGQIRMMQTALQRLFRAQAQGFWLTERVWEPELPQTLARAGVRYTMLDTNQFTLAKPWLPAALQVQDEAFWDLLNCYATEYAGSSVVLFPASKRLRYWMPFQPATQTVEFLKRLRRDQPVAITFADDGEKFGLWPKTHHWVYDEGWLDQFFSAVERQRDWLSTSTFSNYLAASNPQGRVYLPCGSYDEMLEWSGGQFRNFFTKYPEASAMQQKMLSISRTLSALHASGSKLQATSQKRAAGSLQPVAGRRQALLRHAEQQLYAGQCNCAYWHGVFGGLYLSHLRRAVYERLIGAEALIRQATNAKASVEIQDVDGDSNEEARLTTADMGVVVDPGEGGSVTEWSLYATRLNLLDTLTRRYEPYHDKLKTKPVQAAVSSGRTPASIHDLLGVKEENLAAHLVYDDHRRSAFLDYALQGMPTLPEVVRSTWAERRLWSSGPFQWDGGRAVRRRAAAPQLAMIRRLPGGWIRKRIRIAADRPILECAYELSGLDVPVVALEFNLSLRDERYACRAQEHAEVSAWTLEEPAVGVRLHAAFEPAATVFHFPIETVSESEEGLERTYQGLSLVCLWPLGGAQSWVGRVRFTVER